MMRIGESRKKFSSQKTENENEMASHAKIKTFNFEKDTFFNEVVSHENLKGAWAQLKSNPGFTSSTTTHESLNNIDLQWFEKTSKDLINGEFQYPN